MENKSAEVSEKRQLSPIYLESLRIQTILDFDLYIKVGKEKVLYRSANLPFTEKNRKNLLENRISKLYIKESDLAKYQKYIEKNLDKILSDSKIPGNKKAGILYETATIMMQEVFENPRYGDNIKRVKSLVANKMKYILSSPAAFHNILKLSSFDYYTYTHSVNVCTFSLALAQKIGRTNEKYLHNLGIGAILHDVGKSMVPQKILNKKGALSQDEFAVIKQHPNWGVEIISETNRIDEECYKPVLQHHERGQGAGYPFGIDIVDMHEFSRIVAIADTFDAMTTKRVYRNAADTYPTLKQMLDMEGAYDLDLLRHFVELMGPTGDWW